MAALRSAPPLPARAPPPRAAAHTTAPPAASALPPSGFRPPAAPPPPEPAGYRRHPTQRGSVVPVPPAPAGATVGDWCDEMLRVAALLPSAAALPPGVHPVHTKALHTARAEVAKRANEGSDAGARLPRLLRDFAAHLGIVDHPWSLNEAEALVLHFCQERNSTTPALEMPRIAHARDVLSMASRIAACSARAGFVVPPHCGARVTANFAARGGKVQRDHSKAYPVHLSSILKCEPPQNSPDRDVWEAWFTMSMFCLRTGVVYNLYSDMFLPYDKGFILAWRFVQKRAPVPEDDEAASSVGATTAARHPKLAAIIRRDLPNHRLFPDVTASRLNAFARAKFPHCPPGFDVRAYGARTGADAEAVLLKLPDDITRKLFWWKREKNDMRGYYGGVNIQLMYTFSERRTQTVFAHIAPGNWSGAATAPNLDKWRTPVASSVPSAPPLSTILQTLRTACPALVVTRRLRAAARAAAARRALGVPSAAPPAGPGPLEGTCCRCFEPVGPEDDGVICELCDEMVCADCVDDNTADYYCPAHAPDRPGARGTRKRARSGNAKA